MNNSLQKELYNVIFPIPVEQEYTYYLPSSVNLQKDLIGCRVIVDFGRQKNKVGIVVNKSVLSLPVDIKPIKTIIDTVPLFDSEQLEISKELANLYFVSRGVLLNTFFNFGYITKIQQGVLLTKKMNKYTFKVDNKWLKLVNKKWQMVVPSTLEEKFLFYVNLINFVINEDKQIIIMFPSNVYLHSFYQFLFSLNKDENLNSYLKSVVAIYTGEINFEERYKLWVQLRNKQINVVLSTKIGCFLPFDHISFIIIDEPDSAGYKNLEVPMYNACHIVEKRAEKKKCCVIYATFVPSLYDKYRFKNKLFFLRNNVLTAKKEKNCEINFTTKKIKDVVLSNAYKFKQTIIIFPYKGYSRFYFCLGCNKMIPHYKIGKKKICPECGFSKFKEYGMGIVQFTQKLRKEIKNISCEYIDVELKEKEIIKIINDFNNEKIDVLVSTLVIMNFLYRIKFDNVKTIYFAYLNNMMNMPSYLVYENIYRIIKTFQILLMSSQKKNSEIFLETLQHNKYNENLLKNFNSFYREELKLRKELCYPPFCRLMYLDIISKNQMVVNQIKEEITKYLDGLDNITVFAMEDIKKENREYKSEIMIKLLTDYENLRGEILSFLWNKFHPVDKDYKIKIGYEPIF